MKKILFSILIATSITACSPSSRSVVEPSNKAVVHDSQKKAVRSVVSNNCVRTKWEAGFDECASQAEEVVTEEPKEVIKSYTKNLLVFFDWDKSNLTGSAQDIVSVANKQTTGAVSNKYMVIGHADSSGSDAYNMKLSELRAKTVHTELRRLGIKGDDITIDWRGEKEPLVQTDDNIREPQNRRAEIQISYKVKELK